MLHIILLILKIIGIVLLCILGILFFLILCVLLVPVRYRIEVNREDGENSPPVEVYIKITWFLHLINILIRYPADMIVRARILIFTIFRIPQKEFKGQKRGGKHKGKKRDKKAKEDTEKAPQENTKSQADNECKERTEVRSTKRDSVARCDRVPQSSEACRENEQITGSSVAESEKQPEISYECEEQNKEISEEKDGHPPAGKIRGLIEKIKKFVDKIKQTIEKIKRFFKNIQYTIGNLCDKIKSTLDNIEYYREVLESEPFKQSIDLCKNEVGIVLRKLKPDKFEADIIVGLDNPASTGEILAFYGMLYPMIGQHVHIAGDFASEGTHIKGWLYISGKIRALTFLRTAIKIYFNKNIKTLIKLLKKEAV